MAAGKRGRKPAEPAPMTFLQWKGSGCPPLVLTVAHVAAWCNTSIMTVNKACLAGHLLRADAKIRTDEPVNMAWLLDRGGQPGWDVTSAGRPRKDGAPNAPRSLGRLSTPAASPMPPATGEEYVNDTLTLDLVLDALNTHDFSKLPGPAVQKMQRLEAALKTRVDREAKRGGLIDRNLVSVVFAKRYQIDTNQLRPLAAKVAPDLAAELGVEDPETVLKIEKRLDDEISRILTHVKRLMDDFLKGIGTATIPEELAPQ